MLFQPLDCVAAKSPNEVDQLCGVLFSRDAGSVVLSFVAFDTADLEIVGVVLSSLTQDQGQRGNRAIVL